MADRIKGITIVIDGDTTKLSDSLKDVNRSIKDTQSELKDVEKLLKLDPSNTELLAQKQQLLAKQIGDTKDKLQQLKDAQAQMNANGVDKTSKEYQALEREIIDCEQALNKLEKASKSANSTMQKIAVSGEKLKSVGNGMQTVGRELSKVSAVTGAIGVASVKTTANFDEQMSKVRAISGATDEEFTKLRDKAREMGASTKFSASEVAEGFEYMAMAGWKTEDMLNGISGILNLAAASGEDLATTSDIVTDALTAMNIEINQSNVEHFADVLAKASSNSNTNVAMMGETFKYAAPLVGAMGYDAKDTAVAIGLMANSGIKATQAGTALRGILTRLAKPTDEVENAMETLGVRLDDGKGNMLSLMEVMEQLRSGFGDLKISEDELNDSIATLDSQLEDGSITESEYSKAVEELMERAYGAEGALKAEAAASLAGKNALSGLLAIVNASDKDFNNLVNAIYNADGTAQNMADTMQDNLNGQLQILKSQLEELAISIGDTLMPFIRDFVELLQKLVDKFNSMSEGQKKALVTIGAIVTALGPLLVIIGKVVWAIGQIMTYAPMIASGIETVVGAIGTFIGVLSGPVLLAIGAVVAAVVVWIKNWEDIKLAFKLLVEIIVEFAVKLKDKIFGIFDKLMEKVTTIKDKIVEVWNSIKKILSGELPFPKIKLPHFKVSGSFSMNPPRVPSFGVSWYKKAYDDAYLLNSPTIFGASGGNLLGGGEGNGSEAVVGTDKLMSMMADVVGNQNVTVVLEGDAQGVFNLVRTENSRFMKSNGGYSPLMS